MDLTVSRAITVQQPWARAVAAGAKPVENRSRGTAYRGLVAIHAGKSIDGAGLWDDRILGLFGPCAADSQLLGAVIAVANLTGCHRSPQGGQRCCSDDCQPVTARSRWQQFFGNVR